MKHRYDLRDERVWQCISEFPGWFTAKEAFERMNKYWKKHKVKSSRSLAQILRRFDLERKGMYYRVKK